MLAANQLYLNSDLKKVAIDAFKNFRFPAPGTDNLLRRRLLGFKQEFYDEDRKVAYLEIEYSVTDALDAVEVTVQHELTHKALVSSSKQNTKHPSALSDNTKADADGDRVNDNYEKDFPGMLPGRSDSAVTVASSNTH